MSLTRRASLEAAGLFALSLAFFRWQIGRWEGMPDFDGHFHLRVAYWIAHHGLWSDLPWLPFTVLGAPSLRGPLRIILEVVEVEERHIVELSDSRIDIARDVADCSVVSGELPGASRARRLSGVKITTGPPGVAASRQIVGARAGALRRHGPKRPVVGTADPLRKARRVIPAEPPAMARTRSEMRRLKRIRLSSVMASLRMMS